MTPRTRALLIGTLLTAFVPCWADEPPENPAPARTHQKGVVIEVNGVILPLLEMYLDRKLEQAEQLGADLVILEIDSPGGAVETTLNIADRLRNVTWAHTVAYIPREALSGAAIISLACDEIIMAPAARLGDAGPVIEGDDALFRHAPEKIRSHFARHVRDLAAATGRAPALAEAMVDKDLVVYRMTQKETGEITFMSQAELDSSENPEVWEQGPPVLETREGSFLEVNGQRAVELQLASVAFEDRAQLEDRFPVANPPFIVLRRTALDTAVDLLNSRLITGLLFIIGAIVLYVELSAPGVGVGGLVAGLCFTLFFWSRFLGGTAGWLEVILVVAGVIFIGMELFVIPGFGIAGVTGLLLIAAGIVMASQNHWIPQSPRAVGQLRNSVALLLGSGVISLFGVVALSRYFGSVPLLNRLILRTPTAEETPIGDGKNGPLPSTQKMLANVGDWGVAESPLRPAGKAIFGEEYLDVVTDGSFVDTGTQVRIIQINGNRVVVREITPGQSPEPEPPQT